MGSSRRTRHAQHRRPGLRGVGHRASPGRAVWRPGQPGCMAGSCSDGRNAALTKAEQRDAEPHPAAGRGLQTGPPGSRQPRAQHREWTEEGGARAKEGPAH